MNIEETKIKKLFINNVDGLDPITVYLEDSEVGKGKITIECWGKSWSAYWGAIGGKSLSDFFCKQNAEYLANNLSDYRLEKYEPDFDAFKKEIRQKICEMRRDNWPTFMDGHLSKELARQLYDIEEWDEFISSNPYEPIICPSFIDEDEFKDLDFQGFDVPDKLTSEYNYLILIVKTVQEALNQLNKESVNQI
ncbi:hypothetical protein A6E13_16425 [Aliivibrio fischeri]|uniref:hypothetical protein n=1 Tax=Aliivibrio fischeri TaxID=668 RepID=UPI00080E1832|nr:hypothetical protein [Aliivibrio fischeri]OCH31808.1 hypothetical protein A6E13_16425 [Aliivibrio fischeri]